MASPILDVIAQCQAPREEILVLIELSMSMIWFSVTQTSPKCLSCKPDGELSWYTFGTLLVHF